MKIVSLISHDFPEAIDLWERSVRASHHFLKEEDILFYRPLIFNEYFKAVDLLGIKEQERLCGFIGVSERNIEMLFVDSDQMGKGVGRALIQHAIQVMGAVKVDVNEQNTKAHAFYRRFGFKDIGRSPEDSLGKPYPVVHMELKE